MIGRPPCCQAKPTMNMLVAMASPTSALASRSRLDEMRVPGAGPLLDRALQPPRRQREIRIAREIARIGLVQVDEDAALARPDRRQRLLRARHDDVAGEHRVGLLRRDADGSGSSSGVGAIRMWIVTAPPFCASPAMSMMPTPSPSRCAAMPSTAPTVTTPVPPTPVMRMPMRAFERRRSPAPAPPAAPSPAIAVPAFSRAPCTVTKDGQKPSRQE